MPCHMTLFKSPVIYCCEGSLDSCMLRSNRESSDKDESGQISSSLIKKEVI